jgi:hypothetical protein
MDLIFLFFWVFLIGSWVVFELLGNDTVKSEENKSDFRGDKSDKKIRNQKKKK